MKRRSFNLKLKHYYRNIVGTRIKWNEARRLTNNRMHISASFSRYRSPHIGPLSSETKTVGRPPWRFAFEGGGGGMGCSNASGINCVRDYRVWFNSQFLAELNLLSFRPTLQLFGHGLWLRPRVIRVCSPCTATRPVHADGYIRTIYNTGEARC